MRATAQLKSTQTLHWVRIESDNQKERRDFLLQNKSIYDHEACVR